MPERVPLHGQLLFHRPVIDGPQTAHVKGNTVRAYPTGFQEGLILHHQGGIHPVEGNVVTFRHEAFEAVQDGRVPLGGAFPACPFQFHDLCSGKGNESSGSRRRAVEPDHVVSRIIPARTAKPRNDVFQHGHVHGHLVLQRLQIGTAAFRAFRGKCHFRIPRVPFLRIKPVTGGDLSCHPPVNHLINQRAFPHLDGGGTESNFYCCHNYMYIRVVVSAYGRQERSEQQKQQETRSYSRSFSTARHCV